MRSKLFIHFLAALFFVSCVGEVDNGQPKESDYIEPSVGKFIYNGVVDARAISHDKIEIDFFPAGDPNTYTHYLYVNDAANPVELQLETIKRLGGGLYRYILKDRTINTSYKIKVSAKNKNTSEISEGENFKVVRTFDNTTADFDGVAQVIAIPGASANSVKVDWNPADFIGAISATAYDPIYYKVTWISDVGGPENLNNPAYTGADKFELKVPSTGQIGPANHPTEVTISSLAPGTKYYFQVRAVHKTWNDYFINDPNNIPVKPELNTIYIAHETDPPGGVVDFNKQSLVVTKAPGDQAFSGIRTTWEVGDGTYSNYRLFVKEFQGSDIENEDELAKGSLTVTPPTPINFPCSAVADSGGIVTINLPTAVRDDPNLVACFDVPTTVTNVQVNNLKDYTSYQVKVALCQDGTCDLQDGAPNQGILSDLKYERTAPVLAPFDGINTIAQPSTQLDAIQLQFNAVVTSLGYANTLEVYCIDPDNYNNRYLMDANSGPVSGSGTYCDGAVVTTVDGYDISTKNTYGQISTVTKLKISGITTTNTDPYANYCFAITPAITGAQAPEGDIRIDPSDWVVRCIQPELELPTMEEFAGIEGGCSVSEDTVSLSWSAPTGGLYDDYTVFYKEKDSTAFTFSSATNALPGYSKIEGLTTLGHTITGLKPGSTYQFGVLAALDNGGVELYSEANVNIEECYLPLPKATFKEWTRVFAIGPKTDGRVPTKNYTNDDNIWPSISSTDFNPADVESRLYEGITAEGVPFEVSSDQITNIASYYSNPPGEDNSDFQPGNPNTFDGAVGAAGVAASNTGIISLAWKDVDLEFLGSNFTTQQDAQDNDRSNREFGYRVYRSHDYGSSWVEVTGGNLITAVDYSYRERSDLAMTTEKMAFFTDYSVQHLYSLEAIARARVYLYKIVPVYGDRELQYFGSGAQPHNVIRVTLPPANMALVHRKMSNRTQCLELGKAIETSNNYVCDYNGLGARPRGIPWQANQTAIDLGGDLLVDRFELGCNFTRGEMTTGLGTEYKSGNSFWDLDNVAGVEGSGVHTDNYVFEGFSNSGGAFRGCRPPDWGNSSDSNIGSRTFNESNPYGSVNPTYSQLIFGDCAGHHEVLVPTTRDSDPGDLREPAEHYVALPGARDTSGGAGYDPTVGDDFAPQYIADFDATRPGLYGKDFRRHTVAQAEFGAVYYNKSNRGSIPISPIGPGFNGSDVGVNIALNSAGFAPQKCFINLASIGNDDTWRSRWFSANYMDRVTTKDNTEVASIDDAREDLADKTIGEITGMRSLYDDYEVNDSDKYFKAPSPSFWNADRIHADMPLGRVMTSNASKLPPLEGVPKSTLHKICSTYQVQVGLADNTGAFQPMAAPQKKRLIRRNESVLSAKYPEVFDNALITNLEQGIDQNIGGRDFYGCNGPNKTTVDTQATEVGDAINAAFSSPNLIAEGALLSGSSLVDGTTNTEACTSKYGIHDLAGNLKETNSDEVFCDYDSDAMGIFFGEENSPTNSVIYPYTQRSSEEDQRHYVAQNAWICFEEYPAAPAPTACPDCVWTDPDGDGTSHWCNITGGLTMWQKVNSYAGYCSIVDSSSSKIDDALNFRNVAQVFEPLYNPDGTINSKPISREKTQDDDQEVVNRVRNGDGYFLNFGESNLGPSFKLGNSLDFASDKAKYFNPIVGIPLACANYGARESCGGSASDNLNTTLQGYWSNHNATGDPPGLLIDNFPVGNSNGKNTGLGDYNGSPDPVVRSPSPSTNYQIIRGFMKQSDGTVVPVVEDQGVSDEVVYQMQWALDRGTILGLFSGGSWQDDGAGTYSIEVDSHHKSRYLGSGSRCAVMINEGY